MQENSNQKIVVRIPPSPTGFFHVGRARTALFNYLFAKKNDGKIIFRLEDTDRERSKKEYEEDIIESLKWLGISYDEGPFRQSERGDIYSKYMQKMLDSGAIYLSQESEGTNTEVIRFKNPNAVVTFTDLLRGDISVDTTDLKDFVIARNIDDPLYHLSVVVDDFEMGVTHIMRGDDGIVNTARQILIQEAIGAPRPIYIHVPLILAPDKSKMSARSGANSIRDFRTAGYLPETMVNFLGLLGFNPGGNKELYFLSELIEVFDFTKIQKGGAVFNIEKLDWLNKEYIKMMSTEERNKSIYERLKSLGKENLSEKVYPIIFDHISKWGDIDEMAGAGELDYYFEAPKYDVSLLLQNNKLDKSETKKHLGWLRSTISETNDFGSVDTGTAGIFNYATEQGRGKVLWPLRVVLSGKEKSPAPFTLMYVRGKDEVLGRIDNAIMSF